MTSIKKKIIVRLTIIVTAICLVIGIGIKLFIHNTGKEITEGMLYGNNGIDTIEETKKVMLEQRGIDVIKFEGKYAGERLHIEGPLNYQIPATFFTINNEKNNDAVILLHGQTGDRTSTYDAAKIFLELGFNVLAIDQRDSGISEFPYITFGHLEKNDLAHCVDFLKKLAPNKTIGVYGQSMGAATIGLYLGMNKTEVNFAIMDSSYDNMTNMLAWGMAQRGIDAPIEVVAKWCSSYMEENFNFKLEDVDIVEAMSKNNTPTLIIQGNQDELCTPIMGEAIYNAIPKTNINSELWMIDAPHVSGIELMYDDYSAKLKSFIYAVNNINYTSSI